MATVRLVLVPSSLENPEKGVESDHEVLEGYVDQMNPEKGVESHLSLGLLYLLLYDESRKGS